MAKNAQKKGSLQKLVEVGTLVKPPVCISPAQNGSLGWQSAGYRKLSTNLGMLLAGHLLVFLQTKKESLFFATSQGSIADQERRRGDDTFE